MRGASSPPLKNGVINDHGKGTIEKGVGDSRYKNLYRVQKFVPGPKNLYRVQKFVPRVSEKSLRAKMKFVPGTKIPTFFQLYSLK